jgi:hypothetical protein
LGKGEDRGGHPWVTTHATYHLFRSHPEHVASEEVQLRKATAHKLKVEQMVGVPSNSCASTGTAALRMGTAPIFKRFTLTKKQWQLTRQARWYIYNQMKISKRQFDNSHFKEMLFAT